jgi:cellobiose phosphorylase
VGTRRQILLHAAHQFADGTTWHWWHPLTEEGAKKKYNDDLLWLPFVTLNYLRETADFAVLEERVPFLGPDGRPSKEQGTLYEHCRRAIDSFWSRLSPRGVPLMGAGDWNDGLSAIGNRLKSESVWLAHFLVGILEGWVELEQRLPEPHIPTALKYAREAEKMKRAVNRHFWDGEWYVRATKDDGTAIGSRKCRDGRIFLNAQTWAILNGVAPKARQAKLLRAMQRHLYRDYGPLLLHPAYRAPDASIGYLTRYSPGSRENGGLYTHAGLWAVQAECLLGRRAQGWKLYRSFCPVYRGMEPDFYQVEPYVMPGNVDGPDSPHFGRGGWTWYTGSAAWTFRVGTEWILGVRPEWEGLAVRPCLPPGWKGFTMKRAFRGATYLITVRTGAKRPAILVDGRPQRSEVIPAFGDGREHRVEVSLVGR